MLRPFLFSLLSAFVAAAPAAPVPVKGKKEGRSGKSLARHDQKSEEARPTAAETPDGERPPADALAPVEPGGSSAALCALASRDRTPQPATLWVPAAKEPVRPAARATADLRAGLLTLPPPVTL